MLLTDKGLLDCSIWRQGSSTAFVNGPVYSREMYCGCAGYGPVPLNSILWRLLKRF